jgi:putative ABC transport system permease protein
MLKNYFKIALRSFLRDKTYALINLLGLTVALASVFVIIAYVNYPNLG